MMSATLANTPVSSFTTAADNVRNGDSITVPSVTGKSVDEAKALLRAAKLDPVVSGNKVYVSYAPAGTVAYSYPGRDASVYPGQRVVIYVSAGAPAPPETTVPQRRWRRRRPVRSPVPVTPAAAPTGPAAA